MSLRFPRTCQPEKYNKRHPRYIRETAAAAGIKVELCDDTTVSSSRFLAWLDGREILFDYDNFSTLTQAELNHPCVFKFHTEAGMPANIYPFPVVSFFDWRQFEKLAKRIKYKGEGNVVSAQQRLHGDAVERRHYVHGQLRACWHGDVRTVMYPQPQYWREVGEIMAAVFVPGARNNMLDRGMAQYMAFGACCVAPSIATLLPFGREPVPGVHYVQCKADYSDLAERLLWIDKNRSAAREIGGAAKQLFRHTSTPAAIWRWVNECLP